MTPFQSTRVIRGGPSLASPKEQANKLCGRQANTPPLQARRCPSSGHSPVHAPPSPGTQEGEKGAWRRRQQPRALFSLTASSTSARDSRRPLGPPRSMRTSPLKSPPNPRQVERPGRALGRMRRPTPSPPITRRARSLRMPPRGDHDPLLRSSPKRRGARSRDLSEAHFPPPPPLQPPHASSCLPLPLTRPSQPIAAQRARCRLPRPFLARALHILACHCPITVQRAPNIWSSFTVVFTASPALEKNKATIVPSRPEFRISGREGHPLFSTLVASVCPSFRSLGGRTRCQFRLSPKLWRYSRRK